MNPVLVSIGPFQIYWYSAIILVGFVIAVVVATLEAKRFNIDKDFIFNLAFWIILFGIVGARLYYVLFNWSSYSGNLVEILKIWNGGLAIHGGIIAGFIVLIVYTKKYKINTWKIMDIAVVSLLIAQAVGRWGNLFNGEAHGAVTTLQHLQSLHIPQFIIDGMYIGGVYYEPTFLYESLWCLLGFVILLFVRRIKYIKIGQLTCLYFMWYGVGRFIIEAMRTDSLMFGGFKMAQVFSAATFVVALVIFMIQSRKGRFEDLYNEETDIVRF